MFSGGAFIRSESGRTTPFYGKKNKKELARVCQASRKDLRNSITSAKSGLEKWSRATAYNRSQILYRMAEMMQGRAQEFEYLLMEALNFSKEKAKKEVQESIDTFVYYAGWCDKFTQVGAGVNLVAGPFHNFTTPEEVGVVALIDGERFSLKKLIDQISAILVGGNSLVVLISPECPVIISLLGEIFTTSDLPAGVVNLLSGDLRELIDPLTSHMEVNAISFQNENEGIYFSLRSSSIDNMKRIIPWKKNKSKSLDLILDFVEQKTVWHPIGT